MLTESSVVWQVRYSCGEGGQEAILSIKVPPPLLMHPAALALLPAS